VNQPLHKQLDRTYGSTGAISAFVTSASTGTNVGATSSIGFISISATYARSIVGFATDMLLVMVMGMYLYKCCINKIH
jgi:hypothetical protein